MDVVYLVRPGQDNVELRYSLRSLGNVPHGDVWIAGHRPPFVRGVRHLFVAQRDPSLFKYENTTSLLEAIAEHGPDEFVLFNDDFFCVSPVPRFPRTGHRGSLVELARQREGRYGRLLTSTARILQAAGNPDPLAYTLHMPMHMTREGLALTLDYGQRHRMPGELVSWRSLYGNMLRVGGELSPDVKVHGGEALPAGAWVSTNDASFRYHFVGEVIRRKLAAPSPYEQV